MLASSRSGPDTEAPAESMNSRSTLERVLGSFTEVHEGEGPTALLLTLDIFVVLCAYYVNKPVREALIMSVPKGA